MAMSPIRQADRLRESYRGRSVVHCKECGLFTQSGKTFCSEHSYMERYAQDVRLRIAQRDKEINDLEKNGGPLTTGGSLSKEILGHLCNTHCTTRRLSRDLQLSETVINAACKHLSKAGKIRTWRNKRGSTVVGLPDTET